MDPSFWIILARAIIPSLLTLGRPHEAAFLNDAIAAVLAGKNIDDIMKAYAASWQADGAPSFDDIATARESIQARMDQ